ncbi:MAG: M28 family peptidase [Nitrososphaeria archaeon]|nr:M28 family peptidase [Nitrososphaeria archaeon]NIN52996.1 M28 family peptidase [Nitrososphaeria archaeon]NIQ33555.1 M28 family peptidase [Nitrososphaeria archaeon]
MSWLIRDAKFEKDFLNFLSIEELWKHVNWFAELETRLPGSSSELKAVEYIKKTLESYGVSSDILEFDAYVSFPSYGELKIVFPERRLITGKTSLHSAPTGPEGFEGELVYVGDGSFEDYKKVDAKSKIVLAKLSRKVPHAEKNRIAKEYGAVGLVIMNWGPIEKKAIAWNSAKPTWGNPTPESWKEIANMPVLSITREDGEYLKQLCARGSVRVKVRTEVVSEWRKCKQLIATIKGMLEPEKYTLIHGHLDTVPGPGVTDNATGDSLMLEMARIFAQHQTKLGRSIKIAWWTGHEDMYEGSTWFVDTFWEDLDRNCIAQTNIDIVGLKGQHKYVTRTFREMKKFERQVIKEVLGVDAEIMRWDHKTAEQTFWALGIPSFVERTQLKEWPAEEALGWWFHSEYDTLDKADPEALEKVLKSLAISILRLSNTLVLPFEFISVADEFIDVLRDLNEKAQGSIDLNEEIRKAEELKSQATRLNEIANKISLNYERAEEKKEKEKLAAKVNTCFMKLSRLLNPVLYTVAGRYGQDPIAYSPLLKPIPILQPIKDLALLNQNSGEFKSLKTKIVREKNKVSDTLRWAVEIMKETIEGITSTKIQG